MRIKTHMDEDGRLVLQYQGDAQALVDDCARAARAEEDERAARKKQFQRLLSIPREVLYKICLDMGVPLSKMGDHMDEIWKVALSRDYSRFRASGSDIAYKQPLRVTPVTRSRRSGVVGIRR